jgi:outer membrane protein assembly factor BamB
MAGLALVVSAGAAADDWPQYRGPGGTGVGARGDHPPVRFGPATNVRWKVPIATGHSSPCIWKDRIFLTTYEPEAKRLALVCLRRKDGRALWRRDIAASTIEEVHPASNPAAPTPAVDGERVYAYFGSAGLFAYTLDGRPAWSVPLPMATVSFGSGASPVVAAGRVILSRDGEKEPFLLALDSRTGKEVWKRSLGDPAEDFPGAHATPVAWNGDIVLHRVNEVAAYDLRDGARRWSVQASTMGTATPLASPEALYVAAWNNLGEPALAPAVPSFASLVAKHDENGDGALSAEEFPADLLATVRPGWEKVEGSQVYYKKIFGWLDADEDGRVSEKEWDDWHAMIHRMLGEHGLIAIRPGGRGDVTHTHVLWREGRSVPEVPMPLLWQSKVYMVAGAGIVTCLDSVSGKVLFRGRLGARGAYFASPVAADGHIYFASAEGQITVIDAADRLNVLATNDLGDAIYATPAIVGATLYVRTAHHLYAFAE